MVPRVCQAICSSLCVLYQYSVQFVFVWNSSALSCLWFWAFAWVLPKAAILYWLWLKETPRNLTVRTHLNWLLSDSAISTLVFILNSIISYTKICNVFKNDHILMFWKVSWAWNNFGVVLFSLYCKIWTSCQITFKNIFSIQIFLC